MEQPPAPFAPTDPASALMEGGLALGVPLSPHTVARMVRFLKELSRWNEKVNLTALVTDADIVCKHFLDSLAAFKLINPAPGLIRPGPGLRVLDVGTGAGFPGLVLKLQDPALTVTLLEPSLKKAAFLHHVVGLLGLTGVTVITCRVERLSGSEHAGCYDLITSRALASDVVFPSVPSLLAPGGRVLLFRITPLKEIPSGYRLIREASFSLPFTNDPRTLSLLAPLPSQG